MKKLNIISKVVLMLLVALQVNNASAKTLNESNIEVLAEKIAKSESGINYMAVQSFNAMSLISSFAPMNENERLKAKQRIEYIGKLNNEEFTSELKEEFVKLRGFYDYESYQNFRSIRTASLQKLVSDYPEINTISTSDRVLLFETIAQKFDYSILSSLEFVKENFATCLRKKIALWASCMLPSAGFLTIGWFIGCLVATETVETVATDGADQIIAPVVAVADARLCAALIGVPLVNIPTCTNNFTEAIKTCK